MIGVRDGEKTVGNPVGGSGGAAICLEVGGIPEAVVVPITAVKVVAPGTVEAVQLVVVFLSEDAVGSIFTDHVVDTGAALQDVAASSANDLRLTQVDAMTIMAVVTVAAADPVCATFAIDFVSVLATENPVIARMSVALVVACKKVDDVIAVGSDQAVRSIGPSAVGTTAGLRQRYCSTDGKSDHPGNQQDDRGSRLRETTGHWFSTDLP
ncbi:MAG: hypothetical protein U0R24_01880 [Solirubrobacterales bacterium]